jgi:hypothetical protein
VEKNLSMVRTISRGADESANQPGPPTPPPTAGTRSESPKVIYRLKISAVKPALTIVSAGEGKEKIATQGEEGRNPPPLRALSPF